MLGLFSTILLLETIFLFVGKVPLKLLAVVKVLLQSIFSNLRVLKFCLGLILEQCSNCLQPMMSGQLQKYLEGIATIDC